MPSRQCFKQGADSVEFKLKAQFTGFIQNKLDWYNASYTNNPSANKLGIIINSFSLSYNSGRGVAPYRPALAYSVDSGSPNGAKAWAAFMARTVKPDYQNGAQFSIVPRK